MRHYALYDGEGRMVCIGRGPGGVEITKDEYESLSAQIEEKRELVMKLYRGEIALSDVPEGYRNEVAADAARMEEENGAYLGDEVDQAIAILTGEVEA